ncbi:MAG: hypothetical protein R3C19_02375 [Planctomycetaceae bacterium]
MAITQRAAFHLATCVLVAVLGAVLATDFPAMPGYLPRTSDAEVEAVNRSYINSVRRDVWWFQRIAIGSAVTSSICSGYLLRANAPSTDVAYVCKCVFMLAAGHLLWVQPVWGFHNDYSLGVFAWIFVGGEDGFVVMPNIVGLPLTGCSYWLLVTTLRTGIVCRK